MNKAFHTGASGLMAYQNGIDVISNNVANSNTVGYKATKSEFRELLYTEMDINKNKLLDEDERVLSGNGVKFQGQDLLFTQGVLKPSQYPLDFAISGEGLFAIQGEGRIEYTRNGCFDVSVENDGCYLVDSNGCYVLDSAYNRITLPYNAATNTVDTDDVEEMLGVFSFANPYGLQKVNSTNFAATDISGEAQPADDELYSVLQSVTESSNTSIAQEMSNLIVTQRAYQFCAKIVTTADEIEQLVNSLRA